MLSSITRTHSATAQQKSKTLKKVLLLTMPVLGVVVYFLATAIMQINALVQLR